MNKPTFRKKKTTPAHSKSQMFRIKSGKSMIAKKKKKSSSC